jgi:hypothetical protein
MRGVNGQRLQRTRDVATNETSLGKRRLGAFKHFVMYLYRQSCGAVVIISRVDSRVDCRVKGYQPQVIRCLPFPPNRRDHKSYDRQGTTHSRHFAFHPISAEQKMHGFLRFSSSGPRSANSRVPKLQPRFNRARFIAIAPTVVHSRSSCSIASTADTSAAFTPKKDD